jgi:1-acyl-sn-glycerol-3-phosphate acyltransferase
MTINITGTSSQYPNGGAQRPPATWNPLRLLWGLWVWLLVLPVVLLAALPVLALPTLSLRRRAGGAAGRAYFRLCGFPVRRTGFERLPAGACVIVANHASYIDGPLLFAYLPPRFGFVIKKEAARLPLMGRMLGRLGHHFVERRNRHEGAGDARRILRALERGDAAAFFPEGTFGPDHGIARFHGGAFALAVRTGVPVAPIVIRGTRRILGGGRVLPRWGRIEIEALEPLAAREGGADAATELRDAARERIAAALGEPMQ